MRKKALIILLTFPLTLTMYIWLFAGSIKYTEEITIDSNIDAICTLFNNPDNMSKYMKEFKKYKLIEGKQGNNGAKSEVTVNIEEKDVVLIEKIINNNLPNQKKVSYESDGVKNTVTSKFEKTGNNKTKYINTQEFEFTGYRKIISFFLKTKKQEAMQAQTKQYLTNFKEFAENH